MLRKPLFLSLIFIVAVIALVSANANTDGQVKPLSKKSHAEKLWKHSGHADATAEAFTHWDEDGEVEVDCAKCHSTPGYIDYLIDREVDTPAPLGTTVECEACHSDPDNGTVRDHTSVEFPSGALVEDLGPEALCMECHQGRESTVSVNKSITTAALADDDIPSSKLRFLNIHYYAASANQFGTIAKGGYEYDDKSYDARFPHVTGYNACITCHNPHSLEVDLGPCNTCHTGVKNPRDIRFYGSLTDYDGDGDKTEGIYYELEEFKVLLYEAIQSYARNVITVPIAYDSHAYPYFFTDTNNNGVADESEANYGNRYTSFSARLLRAAYNYQVALKDPAAFAHGGKYIIQLLYDSAEDLNSKLLAPISMAGMSRVDEGHFDGSAGAWRHWDEDGEVEADCAKCHSATGLAYFLENGEHIAQELSNGLLCTTCHTSPPAVRQTGLVTFPSGEQEDLGDSSNLCMNCHQGRESKLSIDEEIAADPAGPYGFINIHYYPTAAILFGSEVHGGYEFDGKIYAGQKTFANHNGRFDTCVECHMGTKSPTRDDNPYVQMTTTLDKDLTISPTKGDRTLNKYGSHQNAASRNPSFTKSSTQLLDPVDFNHNVYKPNQEDCVYCHGQDVSQPNPGSDPAKFKFSGIRPASTPDYDGDQIMTESIEHEIKGLEQALYAQIQYYAANVLLAPIVYDAHAYPYFFKDKNGNGLVDPGEAIYPNKYPSFDATLLKAAYNFQTSKKEPHGFIHNSRYVAQLLVDSIEALGGDVTPYTWR